MMDHLAVLTCIIAIVSLRSAVFSTMVCGKFVPAVNVCEYHNVSDTNAVYLDITGAPRYQKVSCPCTLEVTPLFGSPDIIVTPSRDDPGGIALEVDGVNVSMTQSTDTVLPYKQSMLIRFVKTADDTYPIQCFEFRASSRIERMLIQCMPGWPWTTPTSTSTTTDTTRNTSPIVSLSSSTISASPDSDDILGTGHENDSKSNLVYAVVPTVALALVVAVVIFVFLWRRRTQPCGTSTETPDYVNTGNLHREETTTPNDDSVPQYENAANRNVNRNEQNYSTLEHQREREPTNEHTYSGLTNNANADSVTENEQESNRLVYGNDYSSLEPRPEQGTDEHQYSGLETRRDMANTSYKNTGSAYENQQI